MGGKHGIPKDLLRPLETGTEKEERPYQVVHYRDRNRLDFE